MYLKESSMYISGLVNMASSCSKKIGLSYMDAECYDVNKFKETFADIYKIDVNNFKLHIIDNSLEQLFISIFGEDDKLISGLLHWINFYVGSYKNIYTVDEGCNVFDLLSCSEGGIGPFYFLEDLFFVEFEKVVICFMVGNDE